MINHTRILHAVLAIALIGSFGCKSKKPKQKVASQAEIDRNLELASKVDHFVWDALTFMQGKTLSQIRALAPLKNEKISLEDNPNDEEHKLEFHTLEFDGLILSGVANKEDFSVISATVTSPKWPILHGLVVGSQASAVPSALGQPTRPMKGPAEEFSGETETVTFYVTNGRISKIEFAYYFD